MKKHDRPRSRARRLLRNGAISLLVTLVLVLAAEGACRVGERVLYGAFFVDGRPLGLYQVGPRGMPQLRPGAVLDGWRYKISVNSLGFRGPELLAEKPANGLRVWCMGGSTTFDIFAPDDAHTWPALVQAALQARWPDRVVEVLNAGVPGETTGGNLADLGRHFERVRPDLVVFHQGPNVIRNQLMADGGVSPAHVLERFALYRSLEAWLVPSAWVDRSWPDRRLEEAQLWRISEDVERVLAFCRERRIAAVLATHALRAAPEDRDATARRRVAEAAGLMGVSPEEVIRSFDAYNHMIRATARAQGLPLADLRAAVSPDDEHWGDATHFRTPGAEIAARVVADAVASIEGKG